MANEELTTALRLWKEDNARLQAELIARANEQDLRVSKLEAELEALEVRYKNREEGILAVMHTFLSRNISSAIEIRDAIHLQAFGEGLDNLAQVIVSRLPVPSVSPTTSTTNGVMGSEGSNERSVVAISGMQDTELSPGHTYTA